MRQLLPWNPIVILLTTSEGLNAFRDFLTGGGNLHSFHSPASLGIIGHHDTGFNARLPGFLKIIKKIQLPRFMRLAMRQVSLASQKLIRNDFLVGEIPLIFFVGMHCWSCSSNENFIKFLWKSWEGLELMMSWCNISRFSKILRCPNCALLEALAASISWLPREALSLSFQHWKTR